MINLPRLLTIMLFFILSITSAKAEVCTDQTVADNFNSVSFNQNDGTTNWATDWLEMGESDGVSAGITRVRNDNCSSGNCLRIGVVSGNPAQTYTSIGLQREVNLSGATSATLTFNYRTGYASGTPLVRLWVSNDGGASWIFLQQYSFFSSSFSDTAQNFDLTPYISSNTRIRFSGNGSAAVSGFYVDNLSISYTGTCSPSTPSTEWRLDESSWNSTPNEIKDSIGSLDGTAFNASTVNGQVCKAGDLSANSTSDYLSMDSAALNGATDFSISAWGKTSNTSSQALFSVSSGSQHNELIMWFPNSSTFTPYLKGNGSGSISISNIADNSWHHFLWTRNGTQNCFYVDGVLQGCSTKTNQALSVAAGGLIIGQEQDSLGGNFDINQDWEGLVDEPLIFQTALTQAEVSAIYNNQLAGNGWDGSARNCPGLTAEWRFDETSWAGAANEVLDSSGNNLHGVARNTQPASGLVCNAANFTGSNWIQVANNTLLEVGKNNSDYTANFWVKLDATQPSGWRGVAHKGNTNLQRTFAAWFPPGGNSNNTLYPVVSTTASWNEFHATTSRVAVDTWTLITIVKQGNQHLTYFDGVLNKASTLRGDSVSNTGPLYIGKDPWYNGMRGLMDEFMIFSGALSATEIQAIRTNNLAGNNWDGSARTCQTLDPKAEWRFDEASWDGTANEIKDSSPNNYHGTAFNSSTTAGLVCNAADLTTNSAADYLSLNSEAFNGENDFTLSLWGKSRGSGTQTIVSGSTGFQHNELIMFFPNPSTFTPFLKGSSSGGNISIPNMSDDQWHHYVWTRSGTQNCLYRDGVLQGCTSRSSATLSIAAGGLIIGQEQDSLAGIFDVNQDWEGLIDEMMLFNRVLNTSEIQSIHNNNLAGNNWNGAPRTCAAVQDHLSLNHSGNAFTCAAEPVTVAAHRSNHTVETSYQKTVTLRTSTNNGDWSIISGNGTLSNGTVNDGAANYTFVAADNGSVQLGLKNTVIETLNINVTDGSITETSGAALASEDENLTFNETGFRFLATGVANAIGTQIAGKTASTPPNAQALELQAIRTNPDSGACEAALTGSNNIELAFECQNPGTCSNKRVSINNVDIGANSNGSVSNYVPVSLNFGGATDNTADFIFNYPDAGQIRLHARYNIPLANNSASGNFMSGASNSFVVKPAGLCVEATEVNSNCSAGNVSCSLFKKAGEIFNLRVSGVDWESLGESHSDFCSGNSTTPNFQLNNITLTSNLVAPSPGINASLGVTSLNMVPADTGEHNIANQSISEVGVFTLTATPPSYLGETIAASNSANIGRFYPDRFEVSAGTITEGCNAGAFSYLGQNFTASYGLTAKNTAGTTTSNYRDSFIRLSASSGTQSFGAIDSSAPTLLSSRLAQVGASSFNWGNNGTGTITSTLNLARLNTGTPGNSIVDGPFTAQIGVLPTDADLITVRTADRNLDTNSSAPNDHALIGSSTQRFGRIVMDNAFGPEVLDLKVPLRAEYWNSSAFITNTDDSACPGSQFIVGDFSISDADGSDSLTPASLSSVTYQPLVMGAASLTLGAPNTSGPLNINLNVPDWLKYDFDGNASDDLPSAQAFFGQYRGNDRIIYWRESFE